MIGTHARLLADTVNEKAMAIHLQRLVGALVGSAHSAGRFYGQKVTEARDLTSRLANDARDEDRDGVLGFDSKAQRARQFAAELGLQAYTFLAAAEGAVDAFAAVTGEDWKPYQRTPMNAEHCRRSVRHRRTGGFRRLNRMGGGFGSARFFRVWHGGNAPARLIGAICNHREQPGGNVLSSMPNRTCVAAESKEESAFAAVPLSRRPRSGRFKSAFGAAQVRAASARNLQRGQAASDAEPDACAPPAPMMIPGIPRLPGSAPAAARPRPVACLRT